MRGGRGGWDCSCCLLLLWSPVCCVCCTRQGVGGDFLCSLCAQQRGGIEGGEEERGSGGRGIWRREEGGAFDCCVSLFYAAYLGKKIRQSMQSRQIKWVFFLFIISEFLINSSISYVGDFFLLFGAISSRANDEKSFLILLQANWCGSSKAAGRLLLGI